MPPTELLLVINSLLIAEKSRLQDARAQDSEIDDKYCDEEVRREEEEPRRKRGTGQVASSFAVDKIAALNVLHSW